MALFALLLAAAAGFAALFALGIALSAARAAEREARSVANAALLAMSSRMAELGAEQNRMIIAGHEALKAEHQRLLHRFMSDREFLAKELARLNADLKTFAGLPERQREIAINLDLVLATLNTWAGKPGGVVAGRPRLKIVSKSEAEGSPPETPA